LDCAASTPIDPAVTKAMREVLESIGANPASIHAAGIEAMQAVEKARLQVALSVNGKPEGLVFTSGATEANNMAVKGAVWATSAPTKHLIVSAIEHPSVMDVAKWLAETGQCSLTVLPVDSIGLVNPETLRSAIQADTVLVSVMHTNNETGVVQPVAEIGAICREHDVLFHCDATQAFLKLPIDVEAQGIDLLTLNAHKSHGPKGVGALYIHGDLALVPLAHGGGHEMGRRSGSLNVAGIVGLGACVEHYPPNAAETYRAIRADLLKSLRDSFPTIRLHGPEDAATGHVLNVGIPGVSGKELAKALDAEGILVSASSACHATKLTPSPVLKAMGYPDEHADEALRISFGRFTRREDVVRLTRALCRIVAQVAA
jgi:cysteine desulfurase